MLSAAKNHMLIVFDREFSSIETITVAAYSEAP
jgi:hypothetical protein